MYHARAERWSRGDSIIHRRHPGAKILVVLFLLVAIATVDTRSYPACAFYLVFLLAAGLISRVPLSAMLRGATAILPFALLFATISVLAGDPAQAALLVIRTWLSALSVILLIATTPMPDLIAGLEWLRAPWFLIQVMQFLYRYLMVLMDEAISMRQASLARGGSIRTLRFQQASAAVGVLFARSWARALAVHRAMVSRGFEGRMPVIRRAAFRLADAGFAAGAAVLCIGPRLVFP